MSLAALICAYQEAEETAGRLRATLPLAGRTLVERQARLAASAGANPIIILVERIPADLLAALDGLRREGMKLVVARNAAEAADAVHPDDRLLLIADGLVATEAHLQRLLSIGAPALLTVPDMRVDDRFERIDAHSRWGGLALLDGDMLRKTAAVLNDWDLQSTLLRRAVQSGARQIALRGESADDQLTVAEQTSDLAEMQARIVAGANRSRDDWASRFLLAPVERAATHLLMPGPVTSDWVNGAAILLMALAAGAFASGWLGTGMALLLIATPLGGIADRLAALRMRIANGPSWWSYLSPLLAAASLLTLSIALMGREGWGCLALAATTLAFLVALKLEIKGRDFEPRLWLAEPKGMVWMLLPFAVTGGWRAGLAALAIYAAGSFFWVQSKVRQTPAAAKPSSGPEPD
ncbi:hypothetical protein [Sphingosinicella rhizophila]|nr:hypothetical protein [Sphingosinicella sp. GR2756]